MTNVIIAHQTITDRDAIGHDILGMYETLIEQGHNVYAYSEYCLGKAKSLPTSSTINKKLFEDKNNIIIYHHSIFWEGGEKILSEFKGKKIFKYHNITPPDYFINFSDINYQKCKEGIEQTKRLVGRFKDSLWICDSEFNRQDLFRHGLRPGHCSIVPPFNVLEDLEKQEPNFQLVESLIDNNSNNVLFVGRVAPNKGHIHLINIIKKYKDIYDTNVHLWVVGSVDHNIQRYNNELYKIIKKYNLEKNITFTDSQPIENLRAYYLACDEFLCFSEHEGFCVPIIEAQKMMLPVVTYGESALSDTVGKNQIVLNDFDYTFAASALYTIYKEDNVQDFCRYNGLLNVNSRFSNHVIKDKLIKYLDLSKIEESF